MLTIFFSQLYTFLSQIELKFVKNCKLNSSELRMNYGYNNITTNAGLPEN